MTDPAFEEYELRQMITKSRDEWRARADAAETLLQRLRRRTDLPIEARAEIENWWANATATRSGRT